VGLVRERFFKPRLRVKSLEELNVWLLDKCIAYAKAYRHPEQTQRMIWQVFEEERKSLVTYIGPFDGFHCVPASISKTCTVRFDNNKYSVVSTAVGRPVEVHGYADRIIIRQDGVKVAEHTRSFNRGETVYNPWHYVPVLARKPGALRNAHLSAIGFCQPQWRKSANVCRALTMVIGRWSPSSHACRPTDWQKSMLHVRKRLIITFVPQRLSSIFSHVVEIPLLLQHSKSQMHFD